jgi:protein involved in polysaccharide export with SLBB domain
VNPGSYVLASYNRVDKAIEEANKPQRVQKEENVQAVLYSMSTRNIRIKHKDGSISRADITKFFATKDDRWNPYLREGDVVIVPRRDLSRSVVGVYGEVNIPGRYEYAEGDSIGDLLRIAHGFTPLALSDSIEFTRLDLEAVSMLSQILDGGAILAGTARDFSLLPGDRIVVRARTDLRADYRVTIVGEVNYPGVYPITKNNTRLSEIVMKAGGFTEFASVRTTELLRRSVDPSEIELERMESLRGGVSADDSAYYHLETNLRIRKEIVNVDFEALFVRHDSTQDVALRNEDYILVPSTRTTIYVFGQVVSPGHIGYVQGEDMEYYVRKAGGLTERARSGDIKIVKAKTRQWLSPDETRVEEGDYVWVPKEPERPFSYYMNIIGQTASIVSVAVSIVLLVIQVNK